MGAPTAGITSWLYVTPAIHGCMLSGEITFERSYIMSSICIDIQGGIE